LSGSVVGTFTGALLYVATPIAPPLVGAAVLVAVMVLELRMASAA
jgi:hypothetical protein